MVISEEGTREIVLWGAAQFHGSLPVGASFPLTALLGQLILSFVFNHPKNLGRFLDCLLPFSFKC